MIFINIVLGPLLLLAGLAFRADWREALLPLAAGVLLTASWALALGISYTPAIGMLWMLAPGVAGILLLIQTVRTRFGAVAQGIYAAGGLLCVAPTLVFSLMFYALSGDV